MHCSVSQISMLTIDGYFQGTQSLYATYQSAPCSVNTSKAVPITHRDGLFTQPEYFPFQMAGYPHSVKAGAVGDVRHPCSTLNSREIRRHIEEILLPTIIRGHRFVCALRLKLRHPSYMEQEDVWGQVPHFLTEMNNAVKELKCVDFFISAVTATSSIFSKKPDNPRIVYPALAFWFVIKEDAVEDVHNVLIRRLHTNPFGAGVRVLGIGREEDIIKKALFLVLKDCVGKYVEKRVFSSYTEGQQNERPALSRILYTDQQYEHMLWKLQNALSDTGLAVTLEQYDPFDADVKLEWPQQ